MPTEPAQAELVEAPPSPQVETRKHAQLAANTLGTISLATLIALLGWLFGAS